jgi:hypothetical protein
MPDRGPRGRRAIPLTSPTDGPNAMPRPAPVLGRIRVRRFIVKGALNRRRSAPAGAESALSARRGLELGSLHRLRLRERGQQELGDPVAWLHPEGLLAIGVEKQDADLAPITGVDQPRGVDEGDPVAYGQPRARKDQAGVPRRDLDGNARAHRRPLTGADRRRLRGVEVEAGVSVVGAAREPSSLGKELEAELQLSPMPR